MNRTAIDPSTRMFHQTHRIPVSRLGGLGLVGAFTVVFLMASGLDPSKLIVAGDNWVIFAGSLAMFGVGFWDDIYPLGAKLKLGLQILIALAVYLGGVQIEMFKNPITDTVYNLGIWSLLTTVLWLVTLTNLINLIDGLDGLAGGIALMLMCLLTYVDTSSFASYVTIGMAGALIAFLCYNFPPAKIYMGDGGAYFLGFLIGALTISNSQKGTVAAALIAPAFALALPILDVSLAIVRRGLKGLPIFRPDKKHIHHRLIDSGLSRTRTVLALYAISLVCLVLAFVVFWTQGRLVPVLFGFMCLSVLVSARWFNFQLDWLAVGKLLGNSIEMRKETRYALALSNWLEMEAERSRSLSELVNDFKFLVQKLDFTRARFTLGSSSHVWDFKAETVETPKLHHVRHDFGLNKTMALEFFGDPDRMGAELFDVLSELAAEAWHKAYNRWHTLNRNSAASALGELHSYSNSGQCSTDNSTSALEKKDNSDNTLEGVPRL